MAVLPWLGVPVLISAALAATGRRLPGEVLPVVAFLPIVLLAYVLVLRVPPKLRITAVGIPGVVVLATLLVYVGRDASSGAARTFWTALLATIGCVAVVWILGGRMRWGAALATPVCGAMVFSQGLDGWLTFLAFDNPFGWLSHPVEERVLVSRVLLEVAAPAYPFLKIGLAVAFTLGFARQPLAPVAVVALTLLVCYVGLSPAMFSAANLFAN